MNLFAKPVQAEAPFLKGGGLGKKRDLAAFEKKREERTEDDACKTKKKIKVKSQSLQTPPRGEEGEEGQTCVRQTPTKY